MKPLSKTKLRKLIALVDGPEPLELKTLLEAIELSLAKWRPVYHLIWCAWHREKGYM